MIKKIVCVLFLTFTIFGCIHKPYYTETRLIMGTVVEITAQDKDAINAAFFEIERIDALMSSYDPDSEVSRLNKKRELKVSYELLNLIIAARNFYDITGGAFDITIGPLVRLWNIKEYMQMEPERIKIPTQAQIEKVLSYTGINFIEIDEKDSIIRLTDKRTRLDLGGIAKGYAVDRAIEILRQSGLKSALVNAGGEIYCLGKKAGRQWTIGLENPQKTDAFPEVFRLKNRAVATSGNYEQFFIYRNKRYSHIIDPRTGYPADNNISSVSVFAGDCLTADVLATAIFVLGEVRGAQLINKFEGVELKIITR
ncbi:MAG TPA: FAD:protein FMN transferase [Candidatus Omnitrophica bacterium]|nr:FAD:protein FMN transferase [Candidatus Omnitrophota bacterium]